MNLDGASSAPAPAPQPPSGPIRSSQLQLLSHSTISRDGTKGAETYPIAAVGDEFTDFSDSNSESSNNGAADKWEKARRNAKQYMDAARAKAGLPPRSTRIELDPVLDIDEFDDSIPKPRPRPKKPSKPFKIPSRGPSLSGISSTHSTDAFITMQ
jgi:hypothetical protein